MSFSFKRKFNYPLFALRALIVYRQVLFRARLASCKPTFFMFVCFDCFVNDIFCEYFAARDIGNILARCPNNACFFDVEEGGELYKA